MSFLNRVQIKYHQLKVEGMSQAEKVKLAKAYYKACYKGLVKQDEGTLRSVSIYYDPDAKDVFYPSSPNVSDFGSEVEQNLDISSFGSELDIKDITENEFVKLSFDSFGIPEFMEGWDWNIILDVDLSK